MYQITYNENQFDEKAKEEFYIRIKNVFGVSKSSYNRACDILKDLFYFNMIDANKMKVATKAFPKNPYQYFILQILFAERLKIKGAESLDSICIIYGKPCVYGDMVKALVLNHPDCRGIESEFENTSENKDEHGYRIKVYRAYIIEGKEVIRKYEAFFSLGAARKATYLDPNNKRVGFGWKLHPLRMLELRPTWYACKGLYSDLFYGFGNVEEELDKGNKVEDIVEEDDIHSIEADKNLNNLLTQKETKTFELGIGEDVVRMEN